MFLIKKKILPPLHPDFKQFSGIALRCFYLRGLTCLISRFLASADSFDVWESVELRRNESGWTQSLGCTSLSQPCEEIWLFMFLYMLNVSTHLLHLLSHIQVCCGVHWCTERTGWGAPGKKCWVYSSRFIRMLLLTCQNTLSASVRNPIHSLNVYVLQFWVQ